ncbi:MAG: protein translocase subunit SecD [Micavibrio aeruginosavorus]|uniref:Protein translocase subunit SecD n=1 Tax=Micavibrio aeruginosavorus TaxID=349221 RepID=A0A2W5HKY2_9BACT|nr:MAG: protein translocase subunit SecD [Micavibrio aeruginosavorus]
MIHIARWKMVLIVLVSILSILYTVPSFLDQKTKDWLAANAPAWVPSRSVSLGLDLRGGSHLLLEADIDSVIKQKTEDAATALRTELRKQKIEFSNVSTIQNGIKLELKPQADMIAAEKELRRIDDTFVVSRDGSVLQAVYDERALKTIRTQTLAQSIEIVERRVNETGTREPIIQRQGDTRILVQLPGVENPERIKELMGRTAKLTFHLVDLDGSGVDARLLPMHDEPAQKISIKRRVIMSGDMLVQAQPSFQEGAPVVSFKLNAIGSRRFCDVTTQNVNKPFAVVLDGEVITAPNINSAICGGQAIISGSFSVQEASDLALLLRAGALPTTLTVVEERSVGPTLGSDSVNAGAFASLVAFGLVVALMLVCYGLFGLFASVALVINLCLTFTVMTMIGATLTLPGIAGLVLTIGQAVDANVLIFERMKEEIRAGRSVMSAIDTGYQKAMSSIIDSNLTALISGAILYAVGTGPIKGFAVTLTIGILTSLFSAIMLTRMMLLIWLKKTKAKTIPIM